MAPMRARGRWLGSLLAYGLVGSTIFLLGVNKPQPDAKLAGMKPPGDCDEEVYAKLNEAVDKACKDKNDPVRKCLQTDDCSTLIKKAIKFNGCVKAREEREKTCFRGGDEGHKQEIKEFSTGRDNCIELIRKFKCLPEPELKICPKSP